MKKLMVMAAVAMAALCSQAVAFSWSGMDACNQPNDDYAPDGSVCYLFASGLSLDGSTLVSDAAVSAALISAAVADGSFTSTYLDKAVGTAQIAGGEGNFAGTALNLTGKNAGDAVSMFAVLVDSSDTDNIMAVYLPGTLGSNDTAFNATTGMATWTMGDLENATAGNWVAQTVPEPTSGLLLLLGVAGLALRRRRA